MEGRDRDGRAGRMREGERRPMDLRCFDLFAGHAIAVVVVVALYERTRC